MTAIIDADAPRRAADETQGGLSRWLVLGCLYGVAVAFAVAASPAVWLVNLAPPPSAQQAHSGPQYSTAFTVGSPQAMMR